jgi:hypothetical protein
MVALVDVELLVEVGELLVVEVEEDVVVVGDDVVVELELEVLDVLEGELEVDEVLQSWAASALTVPAPCPRFCTRVGLTDWGRRATELFSADAALCAAEQLWAATAAERAFRLLASSFFWADESRPVLLPQATTKATVNPRPPARNAREPKPIRRLTLEAAPGC